MAKKQFVVKHDDGWAVKKAHAERATKVTDTQAKAIEKAKQISKNQGAELSIQGQDGKFREKNSYGNDPRNING